jgi:tetratricopeptide (TPR) repeat protein
MAWAARAGKPQIGLRRDYAEFMVSKGISQSGWRAWLRNLQFGWILTVSVLALGATQTILALLEADTRTRLVVAVLILVVGLLAVLEKWHLDQAEHRAEILREQRARDEAEATWQRAIIPCLRLWPLVEMDDVDPFELSVHRPQLQDQAEADTVLNPHIPRTVDTRAVEQLEYDGAVLLIGEAASGVTRTAYEVAKCCGNEPGDRLILAPEGAEGLRKALTDLNVLDRIPPNARVLLWLDNVDEYDLQGLTAKVLREYPGMPSGLRIVATISERTYRVWQASNPRLAVSFGDPVKVNRLAEPGVRGRAEAKYPDVDFSQGIAAAFTATGPLLNRLNGGFTDCPFEPEGSSCDLISSVLKTAFQWHATGTPRSLPESVAAELTGPRLDETGPLDPRHLEAVITWAAAPVPQRASLLSRDTNTSGEATLTADPTIADIMNRSARAPERAVWDAALSEAESAGDPEAVGQIGLHAHFLFQTEIQQQSDTQPESQKKLNDRLKPYDDLVRYCWTLIGSLDGPETQCLRAAAALSANTHEPRAAIPALERLQELTESAKGPDHPEVAATMGNLGSAWRNLGEPGEARDLYQRALTIQEREYGPDHPEVAVTLGDLGNAWRNLGEPGEARDLYQRALTIQEREYGPDHPDVAATLNNLGNAWLHLGEPGKARDLYQRALTIQEREYGPDHPEVAVTLGNLGNAWRKLGERGEARDLYQRALTIQEREYGPDHPDVAATLNNLGNVWLALRKPRKARDLYQRALSIEEREYGPNHPRVAVTLGSLGNAWLALRKPREARYFYQRALTIEEREYGPNHPKVAATMGSLGNAWRKLGEPGKARDLYQRALTILRSEYPNGHPQIDIIERRLRDLAPELIVLERDGDTDRQQTQEPSQ